MTSEQTQDTRTAAVMAKALFEWFGAEWYYDSVTAMDNANGDAVGVLATLAGAGYVVVDAESYQWLSDFYEERNN
jgi:hypothetical protein